MFCAWQIQKQNKFEDYNEVEYATLRFTFRCCNCFFRCLRQHGVFVPEPDRSRAVDACGLMCETWTEHMTNNLIYSTLVHVYVLASIHLM